MTRQERFEVNSLNIGVELKRHRKAARVTLQQIGDRLGMSPSLLSRLETGKREASSEEVSAILTVIGVTREERQRLIDLAKGASPGLLVSHMPTGQLDTYISLEKQATAITDFEPLLVPGLVQIPDYTRAVISVTKAEHVDTESWVEWRKARQAIFTGRKPPRLNLIVTELGMRQPVGGERTMARQIRHMIAWADRPNVTVLVIPLRVAAHAGLDGSFVILDFAASPTVVHIEDRTTGLFLNDPMTVVAYKVVEERLVDVALDEDESKALLASIADDLESKVG